MIEGVVGRAAPGMTPIAKRIAVVLSVAALLVAWAMTIDGHFVRKRIQIDPHRATEMAIMSVATWKDVTIKASDDVALKGWLFEPSRANHRAAMFVHGRGGTRQGMLVRAKRFLQAGYTCLLIDQRGVVDGVR